MEDKTKQKLNRKRPDSKGQMQMEEINRHTKQRQRFMHDNEPASLALGECVCGGGGACAFVCICVRAFVIVCVHMHACLCTSMCVRGLCACVCEGVPVHVCV